MSHPTISIILPTRNRLSTISRTIERIRSQSFADWELIISDNASTEEGKLEYLQGLPTLDQRIRLFIQPENIGIHANWAFCIRECRGDYYIPVTDDDWWGEDDYLASLIALHDGHAGCVFPNGTVHFPETGEVKESVLTEVYGNLTSRYQLCEKLVNDGRGMIMIGLFNLSVVPKEEIVGVINNGLIACIETVGMNRIARDYEVRFCASVNYHHTSYASNYARTFSGELQYRDRGIAIFGLVDDLRRSAAGDQNYEPVLEAAWKKALAYSIDLARNHNPNGDRFVTAAQHQETKATLKQLKEENKALRKELNSLTSSLSSPLRALKAWWRIRRS
jgi:glycosyltransferase involved in cell wall biosynthesis